MINEFDEEKRKHGYWEQTVNGKLSYKGEFIHGVKHGYWEEYHYRGLIKYKGFYDMGVKVGQWDEFSLNMVYDEEGMEHMVHRQFVRYTIQNGKIVECEDYLGNYYNKQLMQTREPLNLMMEIHNLFDTSVNIPHLNTTVRRKYLY